MYAGSSWALVHLQNQQHVWLWMITAPLLHHCTLAFNQRGQVRGVCSFFSITYLMKGLQKYAKNFSSDNDYLSYLLDSLAHPAQLEAIVCFCHGCPFLRKIFDLGVLKKKIYEISILGKKFNHILARSICQFMCKVTIK